MEWISFITSYGFPHYVNSLKIKTPDIVISHTAHRVNVKLRKKFCKDCGTDDKCKTLLKYSTKL